MALYRYHIRPLSAFATPLRSDTLYGHLLCAAAERGGSAAVAGLIERFAGDQPPFRLSSAFPSGMLPMPVLPGIARPEFRRQFAGGQGGAVLFAALEAYKQFRKRPYLPVRLWEECGGRLSQAALFGHYQQEPAAFAYQAGVAADEPHNSIDRATHSVLREGGLYFSRATFYGPDVHLDLYVETGERELFEELFDHLGKTGYGADRTTGKGHFVWMRDESFDAASLAGSGSHCLSLSVLSATSLDQVAGYYKPFVKQGKVWSGFGESRPFKKPFVAFEEGAVFSRLPAVGYLLRDIHSDPAVIQVTWPLTIPLTLEGC